MAADYTSLIQQLHLIYLGRQAMPLERSTMAGQLAAASAPATLDGIEAAYRSSPAVAAIVDGLANNSSIYGFQSDAISNIYFTYNSVLGRGVDFDGLVFWANAMQKEGLARNVMPVAIVAGAQANPSAQSLADSKGFANKIAISNIIDMFALDVAPTMGWTVNSPSASRDALYVLSPQLPAAEFVNAALKAYGVGTFGDLTIGPVSFPIVAPTPPSTTVSIDAPSVAEGNTGKAALTFHLTLNAAPGSELSVYYATVPGTAGTGDFQSTSGRIVFAAGQTSATVTVQVTGDALVEQNETLSLIVGGPGIAAGVEAIGTIINDDHAVPVTLVGHHAQLLF